LAGFGERGGKKEREKEGRKGEWAKGREEICAVVIVP